ncbi:ribonuclease Y [Streptacidiphilus pinicola]|uniref:Ribonuclease Y n=1 Tax=Streptacidiphilus pinicola TaxID=2219663 RepID=A0A2X0II06_9ACTN|nr:ribonuclease Y [Streptacidiphilus pinicola]RAG84714.1 ribonuclease Y [Streptacidiphilus pinicola]
MTLAIAASATVPVVLLVLGLVLLSVVGLAVRQLLHGTRERALELDRREQRSTEREARIDEEQQRLLQRELDTAQTQAELHVRSEELRAERRRMLEEVAGLSAAEARAELVRGAEQQAKREAVLTVREIERRARTEGDARAREIIASAIQRVAVQGTTDYVVATVRLPGEDMKGRIIGREGRNIRAFESVTGVNLVIDETPESVLLSCFDPVRREVGRLTLEELIADGRIHPQRIEDAYERSLGQVERLCQSAAQEAVADVGLDELHPELLRLLGRLRFRTSYGQNVLGHLVESAHLAGMMAAELRVDPVLVKRCTLLHDIGKAVTHEVEGSHAQIGAELARRYGESEEVVHAVAAHHNEIEPQTVEAVLTQAADACSGGRPGARRESVELHARRLEKLEQIARRHEGVVKVYAMQAGREVRVMVLPEAVDDLQAQVIAKDVAREVENELTYPGQIRITVIRESRATSFAR